MFNNRLVTIWSAPNYCYRYNKFLKQRCNNIAAILVLDKYLNYDYKKFNASPEDYKEPPPKRSLPEYFL